MLKVIPDSFFKTLKINKKWVSTWSPLTTAFNSKSVSQLDNKIKETGLFEIPELKDASGFAILEHEAIKRSQELVDEALSSDRKRKMVQIFDDLSDTLCRVADMAEFVRIAHPDREYSKYAENACITISNIVEELNTNRLIYDALNEVAKNGDIIPETDLDKNVANLFLFDFEQSGIHLSEKRRREVVGLNDRILQCGQKFTAGTVEPRITSVKVVPEHLVKHFSNDGQKLAVSGTNSDASDHLLREISYKLFLYPDPKQEDLLQDLLSFRHKLAKLCGFPTYAHRALRGSTVENPENALKFLNLMNDELQNRVEQDFGELQKIKDADVPFKQRIMAWDTAYYASKARKSWIGSSFEEFAPYFSLGACMEGINILTTALYGIRLEHSEPLRGEVWSADIHKLVVLDESNETLGYIYCDFFDRPNKPNQDCHFTIRGGRQLADGSYQNPIVVLMLSLPSPSKWTPSLLNPTLAENLFHEMGHALHSMLGRTKYQHITGTRCSTDFAEVPSILMEYFISDPRIVSLFAKHYETGERMPDKMLNQMCSNKHIFPACELQSQVFYSMLDQVYHGVEICKSTTDILSEIQSKYYYVPYVENTAWQLRFSHLVGYGARYYSYLISRAIASWTWQKYFQNDPLSRSSGEKYRYKCLAHGGGKPPSKLVADFLDQEASPINFTRSLINEIDYKNDQMKVLRKAV